MIRALIFILFAAFTSIKVNAMEVVFFPRNDYDVEVCSHRLGKSMTYTEQSDAFRGGAENIVEYANSKGIKLGVFWAMSTSEADKNIMLPFYENGGIWVDAYGHPYHSEKKDAEGNPTVITQEVYEAERDDLLARINDWFGVRPLALSYNSGNDTYKDYAIEDFLACRNSGRRGGTPYGVGFGNPSNIQYSKEYYKSKQSSSRWYDDAKVNGTYEARLQTLLNDVIATKANGGWYNNFQHWHNVIDEGNLDKYKAYIDLLAELNADNSIYFSGYGEAVAYQCYRDAITKAVMYAPTADPSSLVIQLETKAESEVNTELLQVPISIRFSTNGTALEGVEIESECNIINEGNGSYIVEIPYSDYPKAVIVPKVDDSVRRVAINDKGTYYNLDGTVAGTLTKGKIYVKNGKAIMY